MSLFLEIKIATDGAQAQYRQGIGIPQVAPKGLPGAAKGLVWGYLGAT